MPAQEQRVARPRARSRPGPCPRRSAARRGSTRSPLSVTIPGNTVSPTALERGGITTSATPCLRFSSVVGVRVELVLVDERAGVVAEVARQRRGRCARAAAARRTGRRSRSCPTQQRQADERELEVAEARRRPPRRRPRRRSRSPACRSATSSEPAWAAKASGISSCEGERPSRTAITTTTGTSAATAPLTLISAVSRRRAASSARSAASGSRPTRSISSCPAHAVTPVASSASLTTNSAPMKSTAGSPKPASDWSRSRTPVAQSESATPIATIATGRRSQTKTTTTAASTTKVIVVSLTTAHPPQDGRGGAEIAFRRGAARPGGSGDGAARPGTRSRGGRSDRYTALAGVGDRRDRQLTHARADVRSRPTRPHSVDRVSRLPAASR